MEVDMLMSKEELKLKIEKIKELKLRALNKVK